MPGIGLRTLEDGRLEITPSQSWLSTAFNCLEQARLEMVNELPRVETDATAIGTSMHAGIEHVLRGGTVDEGEVIAIDTFDALAAAPEFEWVQIKTAETAWATVSRVYWSWANEILPQLPDTWSVEHLFDVNLYEDSEVVVRLKGAMDFVGGYNDQPCVWDWKTANRPYEPWEKERWAIQPTVYTYALAQEYGGDSYEFTYAVCLKSRQDVQIITVERNTGHWEWLKQQIGSLVHLIRADLPVWPLRDQHALCSPKWCSVYASCKGAHV